MSDKERQKRWRKRHPEEAAVRLAAYKMEKAIAKLAKTAPPGCEHEGPEMRFTISVCRTCGKWLAVSPAKWLG